MPLAKSLTDSLTQAASKYHDQLDTEALDYLTKRGIGPELASDFRLGVVRDPIPGHERFTGRLAIPFLGTAGQVWGMRFRDIQMDDGPKYLGLSGIATRLYNVRCLHLREVSRMCITEGEIDSISLAASGFPGSIGVCGADNWKRHHPRLFAGFDRVYVFGDGDEAGRKFSRRVASTIPQAIEVPLPEGQDVNSILVAGGPEAVRELVG
jgi:DNA primase